jgi:hypothetical protein
VSDPVDRDALRAAAENATPGTWAAYGHGGTWSVASNSGDSVADDLPHGRDAEFIALADPPTVLALLDEHEQMKAALAAAEARADRAEGEGRADVLEDAADALWKVSTTEDGLDVVAWLRARAAAYREPQTPAPFVLVTHPHDGHGESETCLDCERNEQEGNQ